MYFLLCLVRPSPVTGYVCTSNVVPLLQLVPDPRILNILIRKLPPISEDRYLGTKKTLSVQTHVWTVGQRIKPFGHRNNFFMERVVSH